MFTIKPAFSCLRFDNSSCLCWSSSDKPSTLTLNSCNCFILPASSSSRSLLCAERTDISPSLFNRSDWSFAISSFISFCKIWLSSLKIWNSLVELSNSQLFVSISWDLSCRLTSRTLICLSFSSQFIFRVVISRHCPSFMF